MPTTHPAAAGPTECRIGPACIAPSASNARTIRRGAIALLLVALTAQAALADIAPGPRGRRRADENIQSTLLLKFDTTSDVAVLRIPERLLKQTQTGDATGFLLPAGRTILAGLAMSLSAVSLALVIRSRRLARSRSLKIAISSVAGMAVTFGALSFALANAPPPQLPKRAQQVLLESVKDSDQVTLVVPRSLLPRLTGLIAEAEAEAAKEKKQSAANDPFADEKPVAK